MSIAISFRRKLLLFNILVLLVFLVAILRNIKKPNLIDVAILISLPIVSYVLLKKYEEPH